MAAPATPQETTAIGLLNRAGIERANPRSVPAIVRTPWPASPQTIATTNAAAVNPGPATIQAAIAAAKLNDSPKARRLGGRGFRAPLMGPVPALRIVHRMLHSLSKRGVNHRRRNG